MPLHLGDIGKSARADGLVNARHWGVRRLGDTRASWMKPLLSEVSATGDILVVTQKGINETHLTADD